MLYRSRSLTVVLCTMALGATCFAQSPTTFGVVTSNDSTGSLSGWTPRNLFVVDVNNDGIPDLIQDQYWVSQAGGYTQQPVFGVSIANGDGTFKPAVPYNYPPGVLQTPMAFGDFNGDGKIDIAMSAGNHTVAIYLGKGDGTFVNPWYSVVPIDSSQTIGSFTPFVAADFNHDGKLDLAVVGVNSTNATVYILPGQGNGLFSSAQPILNVPARGQAAGWGVQKMLLGDFDGDHNGDLAVVATTGRQDGGIDTLTTHVLYGHGDNTFEDTTPITSSNFGNVVAMNSGDLNSDSRTDLFAIDGDSYRLDTFYGQTDRTFASYSQQLPAASYPGGQDYVAPEPAMADFNDDGRMDLVTNTISPQGMIYLIFFLATPSPGQFTLQTWNVPNAKGDFQVPQVGDFNHDGKPDWVFNANPAPNTSTLYTGLNGTSGGLWSNCAYPTVARGVSLCSPAGSTTSAATISASAHSFGQLRKMELWVDGKKLNEQYHVWQGNGYFNFDSNLGSGSHLGTLYAADVDNTLDRFDFRFTVGPSTCAAPSVDGVHICAPTSGSTTSATPVLVQATAKITGTLARMEVWVDGAKQFTETNSTSLAASINLRAGTHNFTVYAVNTNGTIWDETVSANVP